jgi:hypothetical protein
MQHTVSIGTMLVVLVGVLLFLVILGFLVVLF